MKMMMKTRQTGSAGGYARSFAQMRVTAAGLVLLIMAILAWAPPAAAWWNEQWQYRKKVSFDTTPAGADIKENMSEVPLLVRLHSGNFNFANAKQDGTDIRFVSGDDQTLLKHHIEKFESLEEIALIWVRAPMLSGGGNQDFVYLYYGNAEAVGGQDSGGTYGPGTGAVYHFSATDTPRDASPNRNNPENFSGGLGMPAVIANGVTLNGVSDGFTVKEAPSLDFSQGFTVATWVKIPPALTDVPLLVRQSGDRRLEIGIDETKVYCKISKGEDTVYMTEKAADLALQNWNHTTVTATTGGLISVYLDGMKVSYIQLPTGLPLFKGDIHVARDPSNSRFFAGELDELRVYTRPLTDDQVRLVYANEGPDNRLMQFGVEMLGEGSSAMPVFYLATVVKNITLDGWLVIGCLIVLAIMSWMIILSKAFSLYLSNKDNKAFTEAFANVDGLMDLDAEDDAYENSSLHRIYRSGCERLKKWIGNPIPSDQPLSRKQIEDVKTTLEKNLVEENSRLNAGLVILTMAISGGPFLGLLGTVWGVMNTFAAMAEAGEANIMAIAPGVASALSTTVFGLIVAIPALFGYNYLASRIKQITIKLSLFVDDFGLRIDRKYGGDNAP